MWNKVIGVGFPKLSYNAQLGKRVVTLRVGRQTTHASEPSTTHFEGKYRAKSWTGLHPNVWIANAVDVVPEDQGMDS
jgi:hypothetical protein